MSSPLVVVALFTLIAAGVLIAAIENQARLAPIYARWGWLLDIMLALWLAYSALGDLASGSAWGWITLPIAVAFAWSAAKSIMRVRRSTAE